MFMIICDCSVVQVSCVVPVENVLIVIFHTITLTHTQELLAIFTTSKYNTQQKILDWLPEKFGHLQTFWSDSIHSPVYL